jgi:hypothetical protein
VSEALLWQLRSPLFSLSGALPEDAIRFSEKMYSITTTESKHFNIPILNFRGTPTGIDIRKVVETGILPQINTELPIRIQVLGQVGAGLVNPPWECFEKAIVAFGKKYANGS